MADVIEKTAEYVRSALTGDGSGHDWWHIYRVWRTAQTICEGEDADREIVELAALLHDIADWKLYDGDTRIGPQKAREWLEQINFPEDRIIQVCDIIEHMSFKGAMVQLPQLAIEGQIVQDADRLDAIGAIGIARAFAYGGNKGRLIYNPDETPVMHSSQQAYIGNRGSTIHHFYEKLLLLKDLMNTSAGRRMAESRHVFMEHYLEVFYREWEGES